MDLVYVPTNLLKLFIVLHVLIKSKFLLFNKLAQRERSKTFGYVEYFISHDLFGEK